MSGIDYSVTWTKATIAATVEWTDMDGYGDSTGPVWTAVFLAKKDFLAFLSQPVKIVGVKCRLDPHYLPPMGEEDYPDVFFSTAQNRTTRFGFDDVDASLWE